MRREIQKLKEFQWTLVDILLETSLVYEDFNNDIDVDYQIFGFDKLPVL
jgi:hypothetical protein